MARVHLFAESSNRRRSQDPELTRLTKQSSPPAPTVVPAEDLDVTASPVQSPRDDHEESPTCTHNSTTAADTLATLTAILQNAQQAAAEATQNNGDLNDVVNVVAAHLTSKPDSLEELKDKSFEQQQQLLQALFSSTASSSSPVSPSSVDEQQQERKKSTDWIDQATAATALQMLGLSHQEDQVKQEDPSSSNDVQHDDGKDEEMSDSNVMLIANYPGLTQAAVDALELQHQSSDDQDYKRGSWTPEEDDLLITGIKRFGYGRWKEIASMIPGRKGKQLKQRWDNSLASKYVDTEWLQSKIQEQEEERQQDIDVEGSAPPSPSHQQTPIDIVAKITEKAKEGNHEAIEALLSQALLGTIHTASSDTIASSSSSSATDNVESATQPAINFADAAALALYAQQQYNSSSSSNNTRREDGTAISPSNSSLSILANHPYFISNPFAQAGNDNAAAVAAAVAAMAAGQHFQIPTSSPTSSSVNSTSNTRPPPKPAPRATPGNKRRRSDPALADTQSAAMSIYASAAPITTTINNQTQTVYPCLFPNCGKTFARLYNLKSHSRTHTDDRPFICSVCQTAFSRNHDLKRHAKIHGGDKPHKCLGCNKTFSRLDALKRHKSNQRNKATCLAP